MKRGEIQERFDCELTFLDPAELDEAVVGVAHVTEPVGCRVIYDRDKLIEIWQAKIMRDGCDAEPAFEQAVDIVDNDTPRAIAYRQGRDDDNLPPLIATMLEPDDKLGDELLDDLDKRLRGIELDLIAENDPDKLKSAQATFDLLYNIRNRHYAEVRKRNLKIAQLSKDLLRKYWKNGVPRETYNEAMAEANQLIKKLRRGLVSTYVSFKAVCDSCRGSHPSEKTCKECRERKGSVRNWLDEYGPEAEGVL